MIKLFVLYDNKIITDITNVVKSVSITGDKVQAARKLDVAITYPIWDRGQPRTQIGPGTKIWMLLDGEEIFRGIVWNRELNSSGEGSLIVTAYDYLIYLTKSKVTFNFTNITPEDATRKICLELGIETGDIASTGIPVNRLIPQKTGYESIMEMYTQASKTNGKQYIPVMKGTAVSVIEKGKTVANYTLQTQFDDTGNNILSTSYKDTMDSMVNKVKIYDDKNNYVGEVGVDAWSKYYGLIQENYVKEADKDSNTVAQGMLKSIDQGITIEALGNWGCRTGYAVNSKIIYVDVLQNAVLYIDGDTHTWEVGTGKYTMSLNLSFKNSMDSKE